MTERDPSQPGQDGWLSRLRGSTARSRGASRHAHDETGSGSARSGREGGPGSSRRHRAPAATTRELPVVGRAGSGDAPSGQGVEASDRSSAGAAQETSADAREGEGPMSRIAEDPQVGPQTAAINLNRHNPVQADVYGSPEAREAFHRLEHRLLGGERTMNRKEAAHAGGLGILNARKIWRAMGLPNMSADEVFFTERDSSALRRISGMVEGELITEEAALSLMRAMAQMSDRMVVWQVEAIVEDLVMHGGYSDAEARQELLELLPRIEADLEELLLYTWRRQLNGAVQRLAMRQERSAGSPRSGDVGDASASLPLARGIGFADMVSFTALSRKMNERTLAALVQRFEQRCAEVIASGGGRLIKTIGDEVMYMSESPQDGALIALALRRAIQEDQELPQTRVGFVWGRVLPRLGDLYGPTVNLASRLVALSEPGGVLVDASTAAVLDGDDRFVLKPQPPQSVRGFGDVRPVKISAGPGPQLEVDYE